MLSGKTTLMAGVDQLVNFELFQRNSYKSTLQYACMSNFEVSFQMKVVQTV